MIKSMTGYGTGIKNLPNGKYTVEIKSLNSKFLELNIKLPKAFSEKEFFLRNECSKLLERGKIMLSINAETIDNTSKAATINKDLFKNDYSLFYSKCSVTNIILVFLAPTMFCNSFYNQLYHYHFYKTPQQNLFVLHYYL